MKKYPFVLQEEEKDCGPASLLMIIKYYKGYISLDTLRDLTNVTKEGTTAYHLVKYAQEIGFKAECVKCDLEDINNENIVLPCIANVIIENSYKHFIVIYEINFKKQYLVIADPKDKIRKYSFEEFKNIFNNYLIILYPEKTIPVIENNEFDFKYFLSMFFTQKNLLKQIILLSIFITIFSIATSFYIENLITGINNTNSLNYISFIFIIFALVYILKNISEFFRNKVLIIVNQKLDLMLTLDTYDSVLSLPYHYYRNRTTGDIISRMNDLANVKDIISKIFLIIIIDLPLTFLSLIFLIIINDRLFLIALVVLVLYFILIIIFRKILEHYISNLQKNKADITSYMVETISGFETIKGLKIKDYILSKFEKKYVNFLKNSDKFQNVYYLKEFLKNVINDFGFVIITFVGSILVLKNIITLGELFTFNALIIYFLDPVKNILSLDTDIKEAKLSIKRILELKIRDKEEKNGNQKMTGKIEFKNLTYSFNDVKDVLKNVSLIINDTEKVLILGPSGSGKSTLLKLLLKYYKINRGKIFVDGKDINDLKHSSRIKYINQIEMLFTDTLYQNLVLGKDLELHKLNEIVSICELNSIIEKNNLGYNQIIEENGFNLSGGERQRIVLARTLLTDFDVLIIDEGLNQVDIELERKILLKLLEKFKNKTIIVISHRLNNKDLYDKVVNFKEGKIVYE